MSEGVFLQKLSERITGVAPEVRLYIDSSSSRQLISRKGLGKARHVDVSLLWIQKLKPVLVKAIKGTDNPADLGTKALSRDKIKKYLRTLGYRGDFVDEQENQVRRTKGKSNALSVSMIAKILAMLISEEVSVEGVKIGMDIGMANAGIKHSTSCRLGICLLVLVCVASCVMLSMCPSAAVLAQATGLGKKRKTSKEVKFEKEEKKRNNMA